MNDWAVLEVMCPRCGPVRAEASAARCGLDAGGVALCEVTCPACAAQIFARTTTRVAEAIVSYGATKDPHAPLELLEPHEGPPLTWDDLLDLHNDLSKEDEA
ncbi:MAG TPA: hypothetical protein VF972_03925 [Actinomycetota bacterium]